MNDTTPDAATSANFRNLVQAILNDGQLDDSRIDQIERALKSDWIVDRSEIELLFQVNQKLGEQDEQTPRWTDLFVDNVARLVVMDLDSPGEIDESEGDWLAEIFDRYSVGNTTERRLVQEIRNLASTVRGRFGERLAQDGGSSAEDAAQ